VHHQTLACATGSLAHVHGDYAGLRGRLELSFDEYSGMTHGTGLGDWGCTQAFQVGGNVPDIPVDLDGFHLILIISRLVIRTTDSPDNRAHLALLVMLAL
jgi:hypothetical protein